MIKEYFRKKIYKAFANSLPPVFLEKKFIFIHVPRAAGKSILSNIGVKKASHYTYLDYSDLVGSELNNFFIFSVARDSVDRTISLYNYFKNGGNQRSYDRVFAEKNILPYKDMNHWVRRWLTPENVALNKMFWPGKAFLTDCFGRTCVDALLDFDNLASDYAAIAEKLGLPRELPKTNASPKKNSISRLPLESINIIREIYKEDDRILKRRRQNGFI